jgi:GT2 family glycosyltransferase
MTNDDRLVAIVVAYNGGDDLLVCLRSLLAQTARNLELVVVDNGSTDGSIDRVGAELADRVRVIRRPTNGGYAAGANTGWRATDAPIVAILNQDLTFEPNCLDEMRRVLVVEPRDALVTPKLVLRSDPTRVNAIGNDVHLSGVAWCHGLGTPADDWHGVIEVTAISGAAFMARREFLERLGGLEEAFFMYMEDVDLSLRAKLAGAVCLAACDAVATHDWSLRLTPRKFGFLERNRRIIWRRLFGRGSRRAQVVLLQAEALGWLYALVHGRAHLAAKVRGAHGAQRPKPLQVNRDAARRLAGELATRLPYSTVIAGMPGISPAGGIIDRVVVLIAGMSDDRPPTDQASIQRAG